VFSEDFRRRLILGKYRRWAVDLTEDQLEVILWMVGEYGCRAPRVLKLLKVHRDEAGWNNVPFSRARLALETLFRVHSGDRIAIEEATLRAREMPAEVRASAESGIKPAPGASAVERWPLHWQGHHVGWLTELIFDDVTGCGCEGEWEAADIPTAVEFMAALRSSTKGGIEAEFGGIHSWISSVPGRPNALSAIFVGMRTQNQKFEIQERRICTGSLAVAGALQSHEVASVRMLSPWIYPRTFVPTGSCSGSGGQAIASHLPS
jgi:hypothetical protein